MIIQPLNVEAKAIRSYLGQALGFMFSPKGKGKAKLFVFKDKRRVSIHMLFVFFPLIVAWIDESKKVKHVSVMKPFRSFESHEAKYVLEIPHSSEALSFIKEGWQLTWPDVI